MTKLIKAILWILFLTGCVSAVVAFNIDNFELIASSLGTSLCSLILLVIVEEDNYS